MGRLRDRSWDNHPIVRRGGSEWERGRSARGLLDGPRREVVFMGGVDDGEKQCKGGGFRTQ